MGVTSKELAGKAEGRLIADTVKALLNKQRKLVSVIKKPHH